MDKNEGDLILADGGLFPQSSHDFSSAIDKECCRPDIVSKVQGPQRNRLSSTKEQLDYGGTGLGHGHYAPC